MTLAGRDRERAMLAETLRGDGPLAAFVHGPAGVGKSALLATFVADARAAGATVVRLDCRAFEPTDRGLIDALGLALGTPLHTAHEAADALSKTGDPAILVLDTYEAFRISDSWFHATFMPALADNVRVVAAGREPPLPTWLSARAARGGFRSILLGALSSEAAIGWLRANGLSERDARSVNRVARGHPLALQVAVLAFLEQPHLRIDEAAIPRLVAELTQAFVEHLDAETRQTLDAASVVRRMNATLLTAMLPDARADALDRLARLPFVDETLDGLRIHESVQEAIAVRLRSRDPETHRRYRAAAWRTLRREVGDATRTELWRYTADMLYLLENPAVREAFFPTTAHLYSVEPAVPDDGRAITEIAERHEPADAVRVLTRWWTERPDAFRVVRDRTGTVAGFMVVAEANSLPGRILNTDPVAAAWHDHLARHPLPRGQRALLDRWELSRERGGAPSPVQAATWLDIKRVYMEMRPQIGRLYTVMADPAPFAEALATLGFEMFPGQVTLGRDYTLAFLDFGADSVDGWLSRLAAAELGIRPHEILDDESRELVLDGTRTALTPLEFGVLRHLLDLGGRPASRVALLEQVWGSAYDGGSNVVDVVVASLRKKLGASAARLETVRGVGYRFTS